MKLTVEQFIEILRKHSPDYSDPLITTNEIDGEFNMQAIVDDLNKRSEQ